MAEKVESHSKADSVFTIHFVDMATIYTIKQKQNFFDYFFQPIEITSIAINVELN